MSDPISAAELGAAEVFEAEFLAGIPMPSLIIGRDQRIEAANAGAEAMLGSAQALGRNIALAMRLPDLLAAIEAILAGEAAREISLRSPSGHHYKVLLSPLTREGRRVLCVFQDLTAETQAQLVRRDFVANVSHELRTPLTALMGFIETLQGSAKDDPAARNRFLAIMEREASRMNRLVRDLLQLSRVESDERVRPRDLVDLRAVILGVAATVESVAQERNVALALEGFEAAVMVEGDSDQLTQVFLNLVENALKYGAKDAVLRLRLTREGKKFRIDVIDQGEGIDPIHLPRLTERFYRIDGHRSRAEGGTGLGLAIVKHIITRHRGRLEIDSVKGVGSTFSVLLPAAP